MKSDIDKTINARVAAAFADIPMGGSGDEILKGAQDLVRAVWTGKIYAALPKDKTTIPEYFFDAELEEFLTKLLKSAMRKYTRLRSKQKDNSSE